MSEFLTYKDKPLVRSGNTIYYGDMSEKFVIKMEILTSHAENGLDVADKVKVMLIKNDAKESGTVVKTTEKDGLSEAMNFGLVWLERALSEK